jgi:hypothetical protein
MVGDGETFDIHIDKRMPFGMCVDFIIPEPTRKRTTAKSSAKAGLFSTGCTCTCTTTSGTEPCPRRTRAKHSRRCTRPPKG